MRIIKVKMDIENHLLQEKIVALKIGIEDIDPTKNDKKNICELSMYFFISVAEKNKNKNIGI